MPYEPIPKSLAALPVEPNLLDPLAPAPPDAWAQARRLLDGLPGGGLNIAHEAVDRHAPGRARDRVALRWLGKDGGEAATSPTPSSAR